MILTNCNISIDFSKKYILIFNSSSLPINFDKYKLINLKTIDMKNLITMNEIKYLNFPYSGFVVIESLIEQIYLYIGGTQYLVKKNRIFLPVIIGAHRIDIGLTKDIKIYTISIFETDLLYDLESNHLFNILTLFTTIDLDIVTHICNGNNNDYNNRKNLIFRCGMYGCCSLYELTNKQIDENIIYYKIEKELTKKNIDHNTILSKIFFIDKYVQSDIFRFYEDKN
jgi:hypothetical protein